MKWYVCVLRVFFPLSILVTDSYSFPEPGKWKVRLNSTSEYSGITKNLFNGTEILIHVRCHSKSSTQIRIGWVLRLSKCWNEYWFLEGQTNYLSQYYLSPTKAIEDFPGPESVVKYTEKSYNCNELITLSLKKDLDQSKNKEETKEVPSNVVIHDLNGPKTRQHQYVTNKEGNYLLIIRVRGENKTSSFVADIDVEMKHDNRYLSMIDWPLLPFYGVMCVAYVIMGMSWLIVSARHWRDLLRIQFWIGGLIFLGMLEKAMFYAEYQNINYTGWQTKGLILTAEIVSCAKRTLARMLVIIVSLGFGIVKPRLGPTLHKVLGIGFVYFVLASAESYTRVIKPKNDSSGTSILAGVPLALVDSLICWWVFSALVQTTRTLRLRRNLVKLSLYRHFTNTLVISVLASILFMIWSIKAHRLEECLSEWKDLWMDEAFWHLLFSVILSVIMYLWTPSKNNQRYAFSPLLDAEDDEESEEDELYNEAFESLKMRNSSKSPAFKDAKNPEEDALKWIEEHIPESENPLPVLDSEEEIETTKFEMSKMQ